MKTEDFQWFLPCIRDGDNLSYALFVNVFLTLTTDAQHEIWLSLAMRSLHFFLFVIFIYFPFWFRERDLPFDCSSSCSLLFYYFFLRRQFLTTYGRQRMAI